jgi:opacity protein-like surface antigen
MGLSFGASIPGEDFALNSLTEGGGYALPGFTIEFTGGYIFDYYVGVAGSAAFSFNSPDRDALGDDIKDAITGTPPEDIEVSLKMENWLYSNLMAGPLFTLPVWRLNFDLRALAGLSFLMSPPWEIYVSTPSEDFFERRSGQTVSFAWMAGTAIRFNLNSTSAIRLSTDYFRSKPSFSVEEDGLIGSITGKPSYDMTVSSVNISLGLAWRF